VRHIFKRFIQIGSATLLTKELNRQGHRTKEWVTAKGTTHAGVAWNKMHLYRMFNNRLYVGEIAHHDQHYPGEHEAIVPRALFDQVQSILEQNCRVRGNNARAKTPALLKGILKCGHCGGSMGPTFARKNGKTYRYYLCVAASKNGYDSCPVRTIAAGEIEGAVMEQLRAVFRSPEMIAETYRAARSQEREQVSALNCERKELEVKLAGDLAQTEKQEFQNRVHEIDRMIRGLDKHPLDEIQVADALNQLDPIWDELFPAEQSRIVQLLIERVVVNPNGITVRFRSDGLSTIAAELEAPEETANE